MFGIDSYLIEWSYFLFSVSPGLLGYEGQPGNQGGSNGIPEGLKGYEGQPGNQGGK
ncbi:MAG TPA: hypothetical protein VGR66_12360 [Candidatus Eisenbacteria bacterium]|jgi:hypothetical protein|nr:hypothetical protein [Candidatus Eisenbacteria bacterium]